MMQVADKLAQVNAKIDLACQKAGRDRSEVRLVAVSKRQPVEKIRAALAAGQRDFGENYAQELRDKATLLATEGGVEQQPTWHYIGAIQSNKLRYIAAAAQWVHTITRADHVATLVQRSVVAAKFLVEVNIAAEPQKEGLAVEQVADFLAELKTQGRAVAGLMCMPPFDLSPVDSARYFAKLRELGQDLARQKLLDPQHHLSMGMSADFAEAIAEGSTLLRVGTAIFGARESTK